MKNTINNEKLEINLLKVTILLLMITLIGVIFFSIFIENKEKLLSTSLSVPTEKMDSIDTVEYGMKNCEK